MPKLPRPVKYYANVALACQKQTIKPILYNLAKLLQMFVYMIRKKLMKCEC